MVPSSRTWRGWELCTWSEMKVWRIYKGIHKLWLQQQQSVVSRSYFKKCMWCSVSVYMYAWNEWMSPIIIIPTYKTFLLQYLHQTWPVMHANALLMQYHYFYWNIAIFHYHFLLMIYCNIALLFFKNALFSWHYFFP